MLNLLKLSFSAVVVLSLMSAIREREQAYSYKQAYESTRSELEAVYRTNGHVDSAYKCKLR